VSALQQPELIERAGNVQALWHDRVWISAALFELSATRKSVSVRRLHGHDQGALKDAAVSIRCEGTARHIRTLATHADDREA
jgi:hypothetical protein